jgi:hypothetical protein
MSQPILVISSKIILHSWVHVQWVGDKVAKTGEPGEHDLGTSGLLRNM